ncbi:putative ABC exporter domain-containing protein [uncultured Thomasclavelia sp.]|uniref:putative ABC exporter domain-containing protein n=1 Tax=uncultured Thomasclavelia sp. TaxID=3025759 RepID=UPI0025F81142|nr:putative ABC exporter domain-containing protein [uncultured Thomasclavelia sp.]
MKVLFKLWCLKAKAALRNLFASKAAGITVIICGLFYLMAVVTLLKNTSAMINDDPYLHVMILVYIGFLAILIFSSFLSSRKALFYGEDAFYLFTGPFTRKQIMIYLTLQTVLQALQFTLITLMVLLSFALFVSITYTFLFITILVSILAFFSFSILNDYLYVLSIGDKKYRKYAKIIPGIIIGIVVLILGIVYLQTGNYKNLLMNFAQSDLFYFVPVFGWIKLVLVAYVESNILMMLLGLALLLGFMLIVYLAFINYRGDFYEQALIDGLEFSKALKAVRQGLQQSINNQKVKTKITSGFLPGAWALLSKNFLIMRKSNDFFNKNDLITLGIYIGLTIGLDFDLDLFVYWIILWVFSAIKQSQLSRDLKNYQIYLIPDKPFNKLIAVIIPTFIKIFVYAFLAFLIVGIYYQHSLGVIMTYFTTILGYIAIFVSGSVLSLKIFKDRSSGLLEAIMQMVVMIAGAIPSSIILAIVLIQSNSETALVLSSYVSLVINLLISFLILYSCRKMMNGWEIASK